MTIVTKHFETVWRQEVRLSAGNKEDSRNTCLPPNWVCRGTDRISIPMRRRRCPVFCLHLLDDDWLAAHDCSACYRLSSQEKTALIHNRHPWMGSKRALL